MSSGTLRITTDPPLGKKLLFIGLDGVRFDALMESDSPTLKNLLVISASSSSGKTGVITMSGPGWASILTGVWADKHRVVDNTFEGSNFKEFPSFFQRIKDEYPMIRSASICNWVPINDFILNNRQEKDIKNSCIDICINAKSDDDVEFQAVELLKKGEIDVLFLHLDDVDHAGHDFGFLPTEKEYLKAIERTDVRVKNILSCIADSKDDWLVLCTTDHGGDKDGHGRDNPESRRIFYICQGSDFKIGECDEPADVVDLVFPIFHHLGIKVKKEWNLDGKLHSLKL